MKIIKCLLSIATLILAAACSKEGGGKAVNVSVSPSEITAPHTLSNQTIEVQSDGAWTISALSEEGLELSWLKLNKSKGNGSSKVSARVYANDFKNERKAYITVTSASGKEAVATLIQEGNPNSSAEGTEIQVRVGNFNVRVSSTDDKENAWEYRKTKVVQAVKDCDFDFWGINEGSNNIQTYLTEELKDMYNIKYFSPYSQDGKGNKAQGLAYKKSFTLSDWRYFWLSDTPDVMSQNDISGNSKYNRGGCCGVLTHNDTGIKIFVMVTHGALNDATRDAYAKLYVTKEKEYNPKGYPSFFVGDMNAAPDSPATNVYRQHWKDVYLEVGAQNIAGPLSTYNGFNLTANLNNATKRIDYIYYRNAMPVNYVCFDKKYEGLYPSDHFPIYSDMIVKATVEN
jgi:endonuclease/exonuclease/phosphatase family metal-dependent hydrolase